MALAVVAAEDQRFPTHSGFDTAAIMAAVEDRLDGRVGRVAAARELFEEAGVLISDQPIPQAERDEWRKQDGDPRPGLGAVAGGVRDRRIGRGDARSRRARRRRCRTPSRGRRPR